MTATVSRETPGPATDLVTWLLEQIDADERELRSWEEWLHGRYPWVAFGSDWTLGDFDLAKALAECDAKRRIVRWATFPHQGSEDEWESEGDRAVATHIGDSVLRALAAPYADRPGYRKEWRP